MNRLSRETSPYLLQHADNPVEWWPWCAEAFDVARERDRPVLLSIGYAACHWCHVMAHESFEDPQVASVMNDRFVNIKVDREERPDIDSVYMEATQAMTGSGGWPMTAFLTPEGRPFYCGTYFPPVPMQGMPSFTQVLDAITTTWLERRGEIEQAGAQMAEVMSRPVVTGGEVPDRALLDQAVSSLAEQFDAEYAGFGGAPKFPPSMVLEFLLRNAARNGPASPALAMASATLEAMARSGMYDQIGGGFARYSVDRAWIVPHFEKMLYDNALLLRAYVHWHRLADNDLGVRVALETAEFLVGELRRDDAGFASSLDADTEEGEGSYYVWTPAQLADVFGPDRGREVAELFGVTADGTFEAGASTLRLVGTPGPDLGDIRARLLEARSARRPPGVDDKVVTAWNGLAITALAELGMVLDRPEFVRAAVETGELMATLHTGPDGRLVRSSKAGVAGEAAGVLEDYANLAEAYLALLTATGDVVWLDRAGSLLDVVLSQFFGPDGQVYDTAADAPALIKRPQDPTESSTPSGRFAASGALLSYAAVTGSARHRTAAEQALAIAGHLAERAPRACGWGLAVAEAYAAGPLEIAVAGSPDLAGFAELRAHAWRSTSPGAVVVAGQASGVPLLADRPLVDGRPTAYVCQGFVCDQPVTEVGRLDERIHPWRGRAGGAAESGA